MTWPDTLRYGRLPHLQGLQSFSRFKTEDIKQTKSMSLIWFFAATVSAREKQILRQRPLYQLAFLQPSGEEFLCKSKPKHATTTRVFWVLFQFSRFVPSFIFYSQSLTTNSSPHQWFFGKRLQSCFIATAGHDEVRPTSSKKFPREIVKTKSTLIFGTRAFWVNTLETTSDVMGCPAQVTTADIHQRIDSSGFHQPCDVLQVHTGLQLATPQGFSCCCPQMEFPWHALWSWLASARLKEARQSWKALDFKLLNIGKISSISLPPAAKKKLTKCK